MGECERSCARQTFRDITMFMPDLSDVGAPAKGPGLPQRIPEAPPPPVRVNIEHGRNVELGEHLKQEILTKVPGALVDTAIGADDSLEIEINEIVEITKWGHRGKSFLHLYLCSVAEGGG